MLHVFILAVTMTLISSYLLKGKNIDLKKFHVWYAKIDSGGWGPV